MVEAGNESVKWQVKGPQDQGPWPRARRLDSQEIELQ